LSLLFVVLAAGIADIYLQNRMDQRQDRAADEAVMLKKCSNNFVPGVLMTWKEDHFSRISYSWFV
jgi:hypothetical protein